MAALALPRRDLLRLAEDREQDIGKVLCDEPQRATGLADVSHVRRAEFSATAGWVGLRVGYPSTLESRVSIPWVKSAFTNRVP